MLEIRSKRRRDSTRPTEVEATKSTATSRNQLMVDTPSEKPKKRRFEDRDQAQDIEPPLSLDFKFTRHPQRTADVPKIRAETQKPTVSMSNVSEIDHDIPMKEVDEMYEVEKIVDTGKRAVKIEIVEKKDPVPTRETVTLGATPAIGRRALGPSKFTFLLLLCPISVKAILTCLQKARIRIRSIRLRSIPKLPLQKRKISRNQRRQNYHHRRSRPTAIRIRNLPRQIWKQVVQEDLRGGQRPIMSTMLCQT